MSGIVYIKKKLKNSDQKTTKYWKQVTNPKLIKDINDYKNESIKNKSIKKKYGICGVNKFVKNTISRQGHDYENGNDDPCHQCDNKINFKTKKDYSNFLKNNKHRRLFPSDHIAYNRMCNNNILSWFPSQRDEDPYINKFAGRDITWDSEDMLLKWITDRMYDDELRCMVYGDGCHHNGLVNKLNEISCNGNPCQNLRDLKNEIIEKSGTTDVSENTCEDMYKKFKPQIKNHDKYIKKDRKFNNDKCNSKSKQTLKTMGYIIPEQYKLWEEKFLKKKHHSKKDVSLGDLGIQINPPTKEFETCMNNIFSESDINEDYSLIKSIKTKKDPADLKPNEINYIKKKMMSFLKESNQDTLKKCIKDDLLVDTTICNASLATQMSSILGIIFKVINANFTENTLDQPHNREILMKLIDIFGDLIPKVFERIIKLSESIEISECGKITDSTHNLHKIYKKLFKKDKNIINLDFGIMDLISNATNQEFNRSSIIAVLLIAALKYI